MLARNLKEKQAKETKSSGQVGCCYWQVPPWEKPRWEGDIWLRNWREYRREPHQAIPAEGKHAQSPEVGMGLVRAKNLKDISVAA